MKITKICLTALLAGATLGLSAQEASADAEETVYRPNWYVQGQFGFQETLGETSFGKLMTPNAQIAVGHNFNSVLGLRLAVSSWKSKAAFQLDERYYWKWNYIAPMLDVTCDLTNLIGGFDPNRLCSVGVFGGVGANIAWDNDEAVYINSQLYTQVGNQNALRNIWNSTKTRLAGRLGLTLDFNLNKHWALGVEAQANVVNDDYNSKLAHNADWYFNFLAGVKYTFGGRTKKVAKAVPVVVPCKSDTVVVEKVVERIVEVPVAAPAAVQQPVKAQPLRRDVFFTISSTAIAADQDRKVQEVVDYLKANPNARVTVTGYADKGTGTKAINLRLSKQRASVVAKAITDRGINADRITVASMSDDFYQPYIDPIQNRVAICVAE